ncbi:MAG: hypothetical protein JO157_05660 [Acetobacteraceae bacterium]|nr:hypothetical protein [Acetobacteraceae bacterium]
MASSRRSLLASLPAVALGATVAAPAIAAAAQPSPDAELLALCAEYVTLDRALIANGLATNDMDFDDPRYDPLHEAGCAMVPRLHELEELIADTVPHTREGGGGRAPLPRVERRRCGERGAVRS